MKKSVNLHPQNCSGCGADLDKWIKLTNGLKARVLNKN